LGVVFGLGVEPWVQLDLFLVGEYRRSWIVLFYIVAILVLEISTLNKRLQAVRITCVLM